MSLVVPGEILEEEFMKPLGLSQNRLALEIGVSPSAIHKLVRGKQSLTAEMALRLSHYFGPSPQFFLNLQLLHDLDVARRDSWPRIEKYMRSTSADLHAE